MTGKHERALAALLAEPTIDQAAKAAGITPRTLYRYLTIPEFAELYKAARRQSVEQALTQVQSSTGKAAETLKRLMTCGKPSIELQAARSVLEFAIRAVELNDVIERLEVLEQAVKRKR